MGGSNDSDLSCDRSYEELLNKFIENEVEIRVSNFKLQLSEQQIIKLKVKVEKRDDQLENVREELKLKEAELQKKTAKLDIKIPHYVDKVANLAVKLEAANEQLKISNDEIAILSKELGIKSYKTRELQDQLKVTRENLAKLECEVVLGRNHIRMLENLVIKYEADKTNHEFRVQKLNSEILDLNAMFSLEKDEKHYDIPSLSEMNLQLTSKLEKCESRNHELENKLRQYEVEKLKQEEVHATQQMVLQDEISSLREDLRRRKHDVVANKESNKLMIESDKVNAKIDKLKAKLSSKNDQISNLKRYKLKMEEMNLYLTSKFEKCESRNHELTANKESDKLMIESDIVNAKIDKLNAKLSSKNDQISNLKRYKLKMEEMNLQLTSKLEKCESRNHELAANKESDKLMIESDKVNAKIDKLKAKIFSKNDQISNLKGCKLKLEEMNSQLTSKFEKCESRIHELENKLKRYEVEKLKKKELHGTEQMVLQDEISSLRKELCRRKHDVVAANKESDKLMIERDNVNSKVDKLNGNIFSKNDQISNGVISDMAEEKKEAIKQQCFSLKYYRSRYVKLCQAFRRL